MEKILSEAYSNATLTYYYDLDIDLNIKKRLSST